MRWLSFAVLLVPYLVAVYTGNYALWCLHRRLWRGAAGLALLAAVTAGLPTWYEFFRLR